MTDEQMNDYYADRCDYRNEEDADGIYYDLCAECFRYDICFNAYKNKQAKDNIVIFNDSDENSEQQDIPDNGELVIDLDYDYTEN